jgi:hypothetical protein
MDAEPGEKLIPAEKKLPTAAGALAVRALKLKTVKDSGCRHAECYTTMMFFSTSSRICVHCTLEKARKYSTFRQYYCEYRRKVSIIIRLRKIMCARHTLEPDLQMFTY